MDLTQSDRDTLRISQQKLNPNLIGNIIEHRLQNPKKYKHLSETDEKKKAIDKSCNGNDNLDILYTSKFFKNDESEPSSKALDEDPKSSTPAEVEEVLSDRWLNMDQVEFDKLEWMSSKAERLHRNKLKKTTQFDREGRAIPNLTGNSKPGETDSEEVVTNGETHDVESLVNLLDSAYDPQVTYALTVISKIANLSHIGYYDRAFDENILGILIKNCLLRARHQLDHSNETICQSALKCIKSLMCNNQFDEILVDRIYPLLTKEIDTNMWLQTAEMYEQEFTEGMKDSECVEIDVIRALVERTHILDKFNYLLNVKTGKFGRVYQECSLDILIRIARHSAEMCSKISSHDIFKPLMNKFLPISITTQTKQVIQNAAKALKLFRIIAQGAFESSVIDHAKSSRINLLEAIIPSLEAYYHIDCCCLQPDLSEPLFKLHLETLRLMKELGRMKFFQAKILSITALARENLHKSFKALVELKATKHFHGELSMDWQYAAHLIDFVSSMIFAEPARERYRSNSLQTFWDLYIQPITLHWINDIVQLKIVPHLDASIATATALLYYRTFSSDSCIENLVEVMIKPILIDEKAVRLNIFKILARAASTRSSLLKLATECGKLRDPKNLPSFGCLSYNTTHVYEFKLSPLLEADSPFILLSSFMNELLESKMNEPGKLKIFINNLDLDRYIRSVTHYHDEDKGFESRVQQSQIAQFEIKIISISILFLGQYYLLYKSEDYESEFDKSDGEPPDLKRHRVESYSNLCFYTISLIGLFYVNNPLLLKIKDQLFETILLNKRLYGRLATESTYAEYKSVPNLEYNVGKGFKFEDKVTSHEENLLVPIYTSCDHPDRFWMFQPIIDYYFEQIKDSNVTRLQKQPEGEQEESWFLSKVKYKVHTAELISSDDYQIVSTLLSFNDAMMRYSPPYLDILVRQNIDEYLCLIGILFLDDNLFLDPKVSLAIECNLRKILHSCMEDRKFNVPFQNANKIIKPLELPLADFFNRLVDQYESASYANVAFANFLLLFITVNSDKMFRRKLFQEKSETCLFQLRIAFDDIWIPKGLFFKQREKDHEMKGLLRRTKRLLESGSFLHFYCEYHSQ